MTVTELSLVDVSTGQASSADFRLVLNSFIGGLFDNEIGSLSSTDTPVVIDGNSSKTFTLIYTPNAVNGVDPASGAIIPDEARVRLVGNAIDGEKELVIERTGTCAPDAPTPTILPSGTLYFVAVNALGAPYPCLLYTSPSPRDKRQSRMPSSA